MSPVEGYNSDKVLSDLADQQLWHLITGSHCCVGLTSTSDSTVSQSQPKAQQRGGGGGGGGGSKNWGGGCFHFEHKIQNANKKGQKE